MGRAIMLLLFAINSAFILELCTGLTCAEVLEAPEEKSWSLTELQSLALKEIPVCLAHLTKVPMAYPEAKYIWDTLVQQYGGIENIPEDKMILLHWATVAIEPSDYENMTLSNIDVIENFGLFYNLNPAQLNAIADRVREDWGGKEPEDYTYYDLVALRQILCAFNRSEIDRIRPEAYKEAASSLGTLKDCPDTILQGLAALAVHPRAFGDPSQWTSGVVSTVGVVVDALPNEYVKSISDEIMLRAKSAFRSKFN